MSRNFLIQTTKEKAPFYAANFMQKYNKKRADFSVRSLNVENVRGS